eukprot:TRINITY_DN23541_c0_g1_i1.p1 TRINITY_DN23541_c0_g1~~TRINITY_DN23541_c0_g1_i1.p1  ORF type:complete len:106 (-),score=5.45 TRINITY_DN23541_c0_g1_i1:71-388(-)
MIRGDFEKYAHDLFMKKVLQEKCLSGYDVSRAYLSLLSYWISLSNKDQSEKEPVYVGYNTMVQVLKMVHQLCELFLKTDFIVNTEKSQLNRTSSPLSLSRNVQKR